MVDQKCEYYKGIDLLKFIFSFFVVAIHVAPFSSINSLVNYGIQNYLARLAVPFYFVSSGFFLFNKIDKNGDKNEALRYAKRILKLYLIWTIVYFPFKLNDMLHSTKGLGTEIVLWIRNCLFTGSYIHLWYLNALAFSVVMVYLLVYLFKLSIEKVIIIGGGVILHWTTWTILFWLVIVIKRSSLGLGFFNRNTKYHCNNSKRFV